MERMTKIFLSASKTLHTRMLTGARPAGRTPPAELDEGPPEAAAPDGDGP
jgi:hypothetical protein